MPRAQTICARAAGHKGIHLTAQALADKQRRKRGEHVPDRRGAYSGPHVLPLQEIHALEEGDRCGKWMPSRQTYCARPPGHSGKCISEAALLQRAMNRPRKTTRRRGVRGADDPVVRARWRRAHKFRRLGISEERFNELLEIQGYACAICREDFGDKFPQADHDPSCCPKQLKATARTCGECLRGLLCVPCNTNLGWFEENRELVMAYLAAASEGYQPWFGDEKAPPIPGGAFLVGRSGIEPLTSAV
jgi:hypothetical protein